MISFHNNLVVLCIILGQFSAAWASKRYQPNIVLLFADDAGYGDFGFHGSSQFKTPNLDQLAAEGVILRSFYVTEATCGPSRAGMLTGRYQQRFGFEENNVLGMMSNNSKLDADEMGLPIHLQTVGNFLQELGYRTAIFGKWHMGHADCYHPLKRGFDEFYGFRGGARSYYAYPNPTDNRPENLIERNLGNYEEHKGYLTDAIAQQACDFIERNKDLSFFVYVSFNAIHTPLEADTKDEDEFPQLKGKRRTAAQMMLSLDRACGQIRIKLEELGLKDNTLIVFTNDNGGPSDTNASSNYPFSGVKATLLEGGIRVPAIVAWPGKIPAETTYDNPLSTLDLLPTFVKAGGGDPASIEGLDGVDIIPYLQEKKSGRPHQTLFWKLETRAAIRDGDWKLLRYPDRPAELFDLAEDPAEQNNLAHDRPELVQSLFRKLFAWEVQLARPLFMPGRFSEEWTSRRTDQFRHPPSSN